MYRKPLSFFLLFFRFLRLKHLVQVSACRLSVCRKACEGLWWKNGQTWNRNVTDISGFKETVQEILPLKIAKTVAHSYNSITSNRNLLRVLGTKFHQIHFWGLIRNRLGSWWHQETNSKPFFFKD